MICPSCGLELPGHARFCARCGTRLPPSPRRLPGIRSRLPAIALLCLGAMLAGLIAAGYALIFSDPELSAGGGNRLDPGQVRTTSAVLAIAGTLMVGIQVVALIGLSRGRDWGRVVATVAAAGWAVTCLGLPLAALLLHFVWRRRNRSPAAG